MKRNFRSGRSLAGWMLFLGIVVAGIALLVSLGLLGRSQREAAAAGEQYTLEGQIFGDGYTTGNLCASTGSGDCWHDGDNVPHRLTITGLTVGTTYTCLQLEHDFTDSAGVIGYDNFNSFGSLDGSATGVSATANPPSAPVGGITMIVYDVVFTAQSATVVLNWNAQLGPHADQWSGAKLHVTLDRGAVCESVGEKTVPLPVNQIVPPSTPTPTPTSTNTPTPTSTFTPTPTATSTNTPTPTNTFTPIPTNTNTPTPTLTPRATEERRHTSTPTKVPTATAAPTIAPPTPTPVSQVLPAVVLPQTGSGGDSSPGTTISAVLMSMAGVILLLSGLRLSRRRDRQS